MTRNFTWAMLLNIYRAFGVLALSCFHVCDDWVWSSALGIRRHQMSSDLGTRWAIIDKPDWLTSFASRPVTDVNRRGVRLHPTPDRTAWCNYVGDSSSVCHHSSLFKKGLWFLLSKVFIWISGCIGRVNSTNQWLINGQAGIEVKPNFKINTKNSVRKMLRSV